MGIKVMTIEEIEKDVMTSDYKRVGLFDNKGNQLVAFNSKSTPLETRFVEIKKRLASQAMIDGIYQVQAKHWGNRVQPVYYYTNVGDAGKGLSDIEIEKVNEIVVPQNRIETGKVDADKYNELYREKLELEVKIEQYESANEELYQENVRLTTEIEQLEKEVPEDSEQGFLSDSTTKFLSSSIETLIPLADKMLEQRDRNLALKELELKMGLLKQQGVTAPSIPQNAESQQQPLDDAGNEITDEEEAYILAMENLKATNPELYNMAMARLSQHENQTQA